MQLPIYLDYNATTPVDPRVLDAMLPYLKEYFGNASSKSHTHGLIASQAVENSRKIIADFFNAPVEDVIFTSGATESINTAIKGAVESLYPAKTHVITSTVEHEATLNVLRYLESKGIQVSYIPVDGEGYVDLDILQKAITPRTGLISIIAANNEIGTIQNLQKLSDICRKRNVLLHLDFSQATGRVPLDLQKTPVDFISFSGHKIYAPKGIGCLIINSQNVPSSFVPLLHGGGQEKNIRGGTLNVPYIVALGKAIELINEISADENKRIELLRDRFFDGLCKNVTDVYINGPQKNRLSTNLNVLFKGVSSDTLMMNTRSIACSNTSACSSGSPEPSHVLLAIGRTIEEAKSSLRFGFGRFTTQSEVDAAVGTIARAVNTLRMQL
jgi:cysteine desulfurase